MKDPQEPGRHPGDEEPEQTPLIPPPRAAADDRPPPARPRSVPAPRNGDGNHSTRGPGLPGSDLSPPHWTGAAAESYREAPWEAAHDVPPEPPHESPREIPREGDGHHPWSDALAGHTPDAASAGIPHPTGEASTAEPGPGPEGPESGPGQEPGPLEHSVLKSLLGAWALSACSAEEAQAVEAHLTDCAPCAGEALRLRDAVALLQREDNLDLDPHLRGRVLQGALDRRPPRIPIPLWAAPFDAEAARLDALLRDMADAEWRAPVRLRWFEDEETRVRTATVADVINHLTAVDGLVAGLLGAADPLVEAGLTGTGGRSAAELGPTERTEAYWRLGSRPSGPLVRAPWREQTHALVRGTALVDPAVADREVRGLELPLRDAFLDRAFECWVHACDIADAVDYPHPAPEGGHLRQLVGLAARMLPSVLAERRRDGRAAPPRRFAVAGAPGRTLHLEVEGSGGGEWFIPLDSPGATGTAEGAVAHVALDGVEFCQLAAGHVSPLEAAAGAEGDPEAIRDVLFATASMSRL